MAVPFVSGVNFSDNWYKFILSIFGIVLTYFLFKYDANSERLDIKQKQIAKNEAFIDSLRNEHKISVWKDDLTFQIKIDSVRKIEHLEDSVKSNVLSYYSNKRLESINKRLLFENLINEHAVKQKIELSEKDSLKRRDALFSFIIINSVFAILVYVYILFKQHISRTELERTSYYNRDIGYSNCQSCGKMFCSMVKHGTEPDGSKNYCFCSKCYANGDFVEPNLTYEEMHRKLHVERMESANYERENSITRMPILTILISFFSLIWKNEKKRDRFKQEVILHNVLSKLERWRDPFL